MKENVIQLMTFRQSVETGSQPETKNAMTATLKQVMDAARAVKLSSTQDFTATILYLLNVKQSVETDSNEELKNVMTSIQTAETDVARLVN